LKALEWGAFRRPGASDPLPKKSAGCAICESDDGLPVAVGEDFEYHTSPDTFLAMACQKCGLVYLNPQPTLEALDRIYPPDYHAYQFSAEQFGLVYYMRRRLEAQRLLSYCGSLGPEARILDLGCGDGFHLRLLRTFGKPGWRLEGVDASERAVEAGGRQGTEIHQGFLEHLDLPPASYDLALLIAVIEHVPNPVAVLEATWRLLKPGGTIVIVTDNTRSLDFALFGGRHWGGYHFPRHLYLFSPASMRALAAKTGFEVTGLETIVSPVNWVYSIRNGLVDYHAPRWLIDRFSLRSVSSLAVFTFLDTLLQWTGRGALLKVALRKPAA
jgi:2-polyprenyl-3-methyl-5-hydroxy-6-metoxy-1,4-benzoquinol methylase